LPIVRQQLGRLGLDLSAFGTSRDEIELLLAKQDVTNLAKFLAKIYVAFCPGQYDNELNAKAHEEVTSPELDQHLMSDGELLGNYNVISAFGSGGTSMGLSRYIENEYSRKSVRVVFLLTGETRAELEQGKRHLVCTCTTLGCTWDGTKWISKPPR
jgi:cysteine synthase